MEDIIHRVSKAIVEVTNICMVLFTCDIFHVGVVSWDRKRDTYLYHLRMLTYIVEQDYLSSKNMYLHSRK